jgi:hypothetical protein
MHFYGIFQESFLALLFCRRVSYLILEKNISNIVNMHVLHNSQQIHFFFWHGTILQMFYQEFCNYHGSTYEVHKENKKHSMSTKEC